MSSPWSTLTSSAATEHGTGPVPQTTAAANIIFINIDWKRDRHANPKSTKRNLTVLAETTSDIVTKMKPAVICCCEVGTAASPMTREQVEAMVDAMRNAWEEAATKHPAISFLFEDDAPYLTIWDDNRCKCTHGRILRKVYDVRGHRRTAQAFLLNTLPGESDEEGIDVVNVHAPSGSPKLTDRQRSQLLQKLLQSSSRTRANASIGESKFVIGGDMNTKSMALGQMLQKLKGQGILKTDVEVMAPLFGQHGDICVVGRFTATLVEERAKNHDPQPIPYGITWRKQPQHATEHLTTTPPVIEDPLEEDALTTTPPGSEHLTTTPRGIKDPLEEDALVTTPPGLEQPIKEAAKRGSSSSSRDLTSSASSHEGQLSQRPLQKDSLSARHASIISKFAPGMKGTFRLVLKNVETKVMAFQFREDVPGLPAEVMDTVERFAQQKPLGPLYFSYRDDEEEKVQEVDPQVKAAEEVDFDEEKAAAMDATERVESSDNATERVELDQEDVSWCYRQFGRILLTHDLLPHQKRKPKYCLRNDFEGDTSLSSFQRSFIDSMLRKVLGEKRVAFVIWQHGIPSIADMGHATDRPGRGHATERPGRVRDMDMLQKGLHECLQWYVCLANQIVDHQTQEGFDACVAASSLDKEERQQQQSRRAALQKARQDERRGALLVQERESRKRSFDEMNTDEQTILEDFETGRTKRAKIRFTTPKLRPFRCKLHIND